MVVVVEVEVVVVVVAAVVLTVEGATVPAVERAVESGGVDTVEGLVAIRPGLFEVVGGFVVDS